MSFKDIRENSSSIGEKGEYYQVMGTVVLVRSENAVYKACPSEGCKKKVVDLENGMYRCERCNREYPNFVYRMLCHVSVLVL